LYLRARTPQEAIPKAAASDALEASKDTVGVELRFLRTGGTLWLRVVTLYFARLVLSDQFLDLLVEVIRDADLGHCLLLLADPSAVPSRDASPFGY
jgi:hypothetical protein